MTQLDLIRSQLPFARTALRRTTAIAQSGAFDGRSIAIATHADANLVALCAVLHRFGAQVTAFAPPALSPVLDGVQLVSDPVAYAGITADLALDDLGLTLTASRVSTTCPSGWAHADMPVTDISPSPDYTAIYRTTGVGQAAVMAFVDVTNLQLAGRAVAVLGFGPEGRGTARHIAALGGRVTVIDAAPSAQMLAQDAGYTVAPLAQALAQSEVVFATNGTPLALTDLDQLQGGTLLCATNRAPFAALTKTSGQHQRAFVTAHDLPSGKSVHLIANGQPVHHTAGSGVPAEVADFAFAAHLCAVLASESPAI